MTTTDPRRARQRAVPARPTTPRPTTPRPTTPRPTTPRPTTPRPTTPRPTAGRTGSGTGRVSPSARTARAVPTQRPGARRGAPAARPTTGGTPPPRGPRATEPRPPRPHRRHGLLAAFVVLTLLVFSVRLVYVQVFRSEAIAAEALASRITSRDLPAERGEILDANGVVLASSVERYTVWVNQKQVPEFKVTEGGRTVAAGAEGAAPLLAPLLDISEAELGALLVGDRGYVELARDVLPETWHAIRDLRINGVGADRTAKRVYPAGAIAGNVTGFVGRDGEGLAGVEQTFDSILAGTPGTINFERGHGLQRIPGGVVEETSAVPGSDVRLTILRDLQWKAQAAIDKRVKEMGAPWGAIVVIDVPTGEILTLADSGSVDPNDPAGSDNVDRFARSVSSTFEPGSTAKVVSMAAALETGVTTPTDRWKAPYRYTTENNQTFRDSLPHPTLKLTSTGVLAKSSNTGTVKIGEDIPTQVRYDYLEKFGFGSKTGLGLPTEEAGTLIPVENWDGRTKWAVLFGQGGVASSTLQITQVFATVANGGEYIAPHLVKGFTSPDGELTPRDPVERTQVISPETAADLLLMLESAVDEGTGGQAQIPGYRVAGKTG
ncbi:MAG: penicillin-binding protein 2, partial [Actinomycetales bacterium]|nr:penicillin-binding protein 2 [Actinomycetales bacterium]